MQSIKDYLLVIFGIIIIIMFLMRGCSNPFPNLEVKPDRVVIKEHIDTIFRDTTLIKFKEVTKFKVDTIYKDKYITKDELDSLSFVRQYSDTLSDTNQSIFVKSKVLGILLKMDMSYKFKRKPELIKVTDSIFITKYSQPNRLSIYSGLILDGNKSSVNLSPFITLNKDKISYTAKYGLLDKTIGIGIGWKLYSK